MENSKKHYEIWMKDSWGNYQADMIGDSNRFDSEEEAHQFMRNSRKMFMEDDPYDYEEKEPTEVGYQLRTFEVGADDEDYEFETFTLSLCE